MNNTFEMSCCIQQVSYSKAIDYFLMTSLGFIFMSLLEYILVLNTDPRFWTQRRKEEKAEKMKSLYKVSNVLKSKAYQHCIIGDRQEHVRSLGGLLAYFRNICY